jgi:hypothetical protein
MDMWSTAPTSIGTQKSVSRVNQYAANTTTPARLATEVLATIDGSYNGVHQRTLNRLTTFIDSFRTLNFAGDQHWSRR